MSDFGFGSAGSPAGPTACPPAVRAVLDSLAVTVDVVESAAGVKIGIEGKLWVDGARASSGDTAPLRYRFELTVGMLYDVVRARVSEHAEMQRWLQELSRGENLPKGVN